MDKSDCFILGYVARRVGNHGELALIYDVDDPSRYKKLESVFIEINSTLVPFFIKKNLLKGTTSTVTIDGIDSIDKAEKLVKSTLYLPLSFLPALKGKKFYFHEMPGFTAFDKLYGEIGIVTEVLNFPHQAIFSIKHGKDEILIPAKEEFIISINRETKRIDFDAPEGLIDVYLSNKEVDESEKETDLE